MICEARVLANRCAHVCWSLTHRAVFFATESLQKCTFNFFSILIVGRVVETFLSVAPRVPIFQTLWIKQLRFDLVSYLLQSRKLIYAADMHFRMEMRRAVALMLRTCSHCIRAAKYASHRHHVAAKSILAWEL